MSEQCNAVNDGTESKPLNPRDPAVIFSHSYKEPGWISICDDQWTEARRDKSLNEPSESNTSDIAFLSITEAANAFARHFVVPAGLNHLNQLEEKYLKAIKERDLIPEPSVLEAIKKARALLEAKIYALEHISFLLLDDAIRDGALEEVRKLLIRFDGETIRLYGLERHAESLGGPGGEAARERRSQAAASSFSNIIDRV